jgi:hypothetical protein
MTYYATVPFDMGTNFSAINISEGKTVRLVADQSVELNAGQKNNVFIVMSDGQLSLQGFTLSNGHVRTPDSPDLGALLIYGSANITSCTFLMTLVVLPY